MNFKWIEPDQKWIGLRVCSFG